MISTAISIGVGIALDDKIGAKEARRIDERILIVGTADLMARMIRQGILDVPEADAIKDDWKSNHRFNLTFDSFSDILFPDEPEPLVDDPGF